MAEKIKVRFLTSVAGLDFSYGTGEEVELEAAEAKQFLSTGEAEALKEVKETAQLKPKAEKAKRK